MKKPEIISVETITTFPHSMLVKGARLLSVKEAEDLMFASDRKFHDFWWLSDDGKMPFLAATVYPNGQILEQGDVKVMRYAIRPVLVIADSTGPQVGTRFIYAGHLFKMISNDLAFCLDDIGVGCFDSYSDIYEESDVKIVIDKWFKQTLKESKKEG